MKNSADTIMANADNFFCDNITDDQPLFSEKDELSETQLSMFDALELTVCPANIFAWEADINAKTVKITALPGGIAKSGDIDDFLQLVNDNDASAFKKQFKLNGEQKRVVEADLRIKADNEERTYNVNGTAFSSLDGIYACGFAYDTKTTKAHVESLEYMKTHDYLTGLENTGAMDKLGDSDSFLYPFSLVIACIDNLRDINDSLGFIAGNDLIKNVAEVIKECFSDSDLTVRLGGGEFCAVFSGKSALEIDMKIKEATMMIHRTYLNLIKTEVSFGCAITNDNIDLLGMYRQAAASMKKDRNIRRILSGESIVDRLSGIVSSKAGWGKRNIRLQSLAAQIGGELGCSDGQINEIKALAKIADIGYLGVSDDLLANRANLGDRDKEELLKHIDTGRSLIAGIYELSDMESLYLDIFKRYDEWQDGTSLSARVVAGAIGFDDMSLSGGRLSIKSMISFMESEKGSKYCPKVVDAIVRITNKHLLVQYRALA